MREVQYEVIIFGYALICYVVMVYMARSFTDHRILIIEIVDHLAFSLCIKVLSSNQL